MAPSRSAKGWECSLGEFTAHSENYFRSIFECSPDAIAITRASDGHFLEVSPAWTELSGYSREELLGMSVLDLGLHGKAAAREDHVRELRERGELKNLFSQIRRKNGSVRAVESFARLMPQKDPECILSITRDITDYQEAVQKLAKREAEYRLLVENQDQLVVKVDPQGRFEYVSPSYCRMFGAEEKQLLGKPFMDFVHAEDLPSTLEAMKALQQPPHSANMEQRCPTPQGLRWIAWMDKAVLNEDGEITSIIGIGRDVTDRREQREVLGRAMAEAQRASHAKDEFMAMLSHELRTPLTPVLASVSALTDDPTVPETLRDELQMIQRNIHLEARLIDDLLDLTRISRGKLRLEPQLVDGHELLRRAIHVSQADLKDKEIRLEQELRATRTMLLADPARVQQVFWNILKNAIQHSPPRSSISLATWNEGANLALRVIDHGAGIDPGFLPRIFDAFEQEHRTMRAGGLGLGLAIARTVVDLHGGTIEADSPGRGKGASFSIQLPVVEEETVKLEQPMPLPAAIPALRIVLVEDHASTLQVFTALLRKKGHQVHSAPTLAEAVKLVQEPYDLLISDLGLPDGSGLDIFKRVPQARGKPAIALSGFGMDQDVKAARDVGFDAHLTKPVDLARLEEVIQEVLTGRLRDRSN